MDKEIRNDFVLLLSRIIENSFGILNDDKEDSDVKKAVEKTLDESDLPYILVDCLKNDPSLCDTLTDRQKIEIVS